MTPPRVLMVSLSPAVDRYQWFVQLVVGTTNRPERVEVRPGGKAMNGSRVLRRLGAEVTIVVPVPAEEQPWWAAAAGAEGVELEMTPTIGATRQTITCIDAAGQRATEIYEPMPELAPEHWLELCRIAGLRLSRTRWDAVVIAGSTHTDDDGTLARVAEIARSSGVPCFVDGLGPAISRVLAQHPAWVKVNLAEAQGLTSIDSGNASEAASALLGIGPEAAVVTAGAAGAAWATRDASGTVDAPRRPGPFPGGSGDAFMGALVVGIATGAEVPAAMAAGRRAAEENAWSPYAGGPSPT